MKRKMFSLLLCVLLVLSQTVASAGTDYTMAEKLMKQLKAGSGFSATAVADVTDAQGQSVLAAPLTFDIDAIYLPVQEGEEGVPITRVDVTLKKENTALSAAHLSLSRDDNLFQADVISPDWLSLKDSGEKDASALFGQDDGSALQNVTGLPQIASVLMKDGLPLLKTDLSAWTDAFTTRIDLWLEGYRKEVEIQKDEAGTTNIAVSYAVPASAIKAEVKTLVLELLENEELVTALRDALPQEDAELLLNPTYQNYYFSALDAFPLEGDLQIDRTVSIKGNTLLLNVSLPIHDEVSGDAVITYQRIAAHDDEPENIVIAVDGPENAPSLSCTHYMGLTDVEVWEGNLSVGGGETAFSLTRQLTEGKLETGENTYTCLFTLSLTPRDGNPYLKAPVEIALNAEFLSMTSKTSSTTVKIDLTVEPEGQNKLTVTAEGKSRKKWEPEEISGEPEVWTVLSAEEQGRYLSSLLENFAGLAKQFQK